jgi:hypothetical protein
MAVTLNPAQQKGGICFGDSGGPQLLGGTDAILAVTSYGTNINCKGVGFGARVDKPLVLEWIARFMP